VRRTAWRGKEEPFRAGRYGHPQADRNAVRQRRVLAASARHGVGRRQYVSTRQLMPIPYGAGRSCCRHGSAVRSLPCRRTSSTSVILVLRSSTVKMSDPPATTSAKTPIPVAPFLSFGSRVGHESRPDSALFQSGRPDLNRGPLVPQTRPAVGCQVSRCGGKRHGCEDSGAFASLEPAWSRGSVSRGLGADRGQTMNVPPPSRCRRFSTAIFYPTAVRWCSSPTPEASR
jgi:hypothetical protein